MNNHDNETAKNKNYSMIQTTRYIKYERELGNLFLAASEGKMAIYDLIHNGHDFMVRTSDENLETDLLIDDALTYLLYEGLSCNQAQTNPEILREYADILLGKREKTFDWHPRKGIRAIITYEKLK